MSKIRILTQDGIDFIEVPDPHERSEAGTYWNAVRTYLRTGDDSALSPFEGETIAGKYVQTDLDAIEEWARRGELDFEDIYLKPR